MKIKGKNRIAVHKAIHEGHNIKHLPHVLNMKPAAVEAAYGWLAMHGLLPEQIITVGFEEMISEGVDFEMRSGEKDGFGPDAVDVNSLFERAGKTKWYGWDPANIETEEETIYISGQEEEFALRHGMSSVINYVYEYGVRGVLKECYDIEPNFRMKCPKEMHERIKEHPALEPLRQKVVEAWTAFLKDIYPTGWSPARQREAKMQREREEAWKEEAERVKVKGEHGSPRAKAVFAVSIGYTLTGNDRRDYKAMASICHPDRQGGDGTKMSDLNNLYGK